MTTIGELVAQLARIERIGLQLRLELRRIAAVLLFIAVLLTYEALRGAP